MKKNKNTVNQNDDKYYQYGDNIEDDLDTFYSQSDEYNANYYKIKELKGISLLKYILSPWKPKKYDPNNDNPYVTDLENIINDANYDLERYMIYADFRRKFLLACISYIFSLICLGYFANLFIYNRNFKMPENALQNVFIILIIILMITSTTVLMFFDKKFNFKYKDISIYLLLIIYIFSFASFIILYKLSI